MTEAKQIPYFLYIYFLAAALIDVFVFPELKAVDSSSLSWRRNCSRKSTNQRKGDFNKSSLVDDILRRSKQQESEKNSSSKSRSKCTCPCQKLKESMEFGLSW